MKLLDIYETITIGARENDPFSTKLNNLKDEVKLALQEIYKDEDMFRESVKMYNQAGETVELQSIFLQGSYGTDTAIKRKKKNADADMAIIFNSKVNRASLTAHLQQKFPNYEVILKKPCITLNMGDEYSVDVAIYYKEDNCILHQNSTNNYNLETENIAKPHELLSDCRKCVNTERNPQHRKIIRLAKYFIKNIEDTFNVDDSNKLPSITLSLFLNDTNKKYNGELQSELNLFLDDLKEYIIQKDYVLNYDKYNINNVLFKVVDKPQIIDTLTTASYELQNTNYEKLMTAEHFKRLNNAEPISIAGATFGKL